MAFSSQAGVTPSLSVLFKELTRCGFPRTDYDLTSWATQGVLLLNTILTTQRGISLAHEHYGWQQFTGAVVTHLISLGNPVIFLLWGRKAQDFYYQTTAGLDTNHVMALQAYHPVAESYDPSKPFTGCNHFVLANDWLADHNTKPINWSA